MRFPICGDTSTPHRTSPEDIRALAPNGLYRTLSAPGKHVESFGFEPAAVNMSAICQGTGVVSHLPSPVGRIERNVLGLVHQSPVFPPV
jgi:hypothetical protein